MSTKEERLKLFREILDELAVNQGVLAKWIYHEDTPLHRKYISRKFTGNVSVTTNDITIMQLLRIIKNENYDLKSVEFSDSGKISTLKKNMIY
jgi:gamma-glutamyltranspeptidase